MPDMIEDEWIKRRKKWARRILRPFTGIDSIKASDPMILAAFLVDVEALLVAITDLDQHTQFQNLLAQVPQGEAIWLAFRQALWRGYCLLVFRGKQAQQLYCGYY